jgi:hypothetical protein
VLVLARVESGLESVRMRQKGEKGNLLCRHTCSCGRRTLVRQLGTAKGMRIRTLVFTTDNRRLARGADELTVLLGCVEFVLQGKPVSANVSQKVLTSQTHLFCPRSKSTTSVVIKIRNRGQRNKTYAGVDHSWAACRQVYRSWWKT